MPVGRRRKSILSLMAVTALAAVIFAGLREYDRLRHRKAYCLERSQYYMQLMYQTFPDQTSTTEDRSLIARRAERLAALGAEFEYAAERFWVPIPSETPPPPDPRASRKTPGK